jgi:hypothetical protein
MMTQWMEDEKCTTWSWGIQLIAHKKTDTMKVLSNYHMCYDMDNHSELVCPE